MQRGVIHLTTSEAKLAAEILSQVDTSSQLFSKVNSATMQPQEDEQVFLNKEEASTLLDLLGSPTEDISEVESQLRHKLLTFYRELG